MNVFRIHIRPSGGAADMATTFDYCLRHRLLGVGWRVGKPHCTTYWDEYYQEARVLHGDSGLAVPMRLHQRVRVGDLAWTRGSLDDYYLARVISPWEYFTTPESREKDIDIANVFRCEIIRVPMDAVPSKVRASFRPSSTFQAIAGEQIREYSKHLWNSLTSEAQYEVDPALFADPFLMLDADEVEDLVFLYLQSLGWYVVPHTRQVDKMSFEFELVRPDTHELAKVQVKTGGTPLDRGHYAVAGHHVFLFQTNELYTGPSTAGVTALNRDELLRFVQAAEGWLPQRLTLRMRPPMPLVDG